MIKIDTQTIYLKKRFPLRISRGVFEGSDNLFVSVSEDGLTGWGEMAPGSTEGVDTVKKGTEIIRNFCDTGLDANSIHQTWDKRVLPPVPWPRSTWRCGICVPNRWVCRFTGCWGWRGARLSVPLPLASTLRTWCARECHCCWHKARRR